MAVIIADASSVKLAKAISKKLRIPLRGKAVRMFPDGETYVRLEGAGLSGEKAFIVQSLFPDQNEKLMELFLTIDAVNGMGGVPVPVLPYFAYGRQDKQFQKGEAFSLRAVCRMLASLGAKRVITVDPHFHRKPGSSIVFGVKVTGVSAVTLQIGFAKSMIRGSFVVAGPDMGARDLLDGMEDAVFLRKDKICPVCRADSRACRCTGKGRSYEIRIQVPDKLEGRNVLLLDDMISTGSTIIEAAKALRSKGNRVYVGCTHGLFLDGSLEKLGEYTELVFSTDTVESPVSKVSVTGLLAEEIKRLL